MRQFDGSEFEGMFDFLILSAFRDGPRSAEELQKRVHGGHLLLYLAAARKQKQSPRVRGEALERLRREGWLTVDSEAAYSLTQAGEQRLEDERVRRSFFVSEFVQNGELDGSFRRFLDDAGTFGLY